MQSFSGRIRQELGHKTPILDSECSVSVSALVTLVELGDITVNVSATWISLKYPHLKTGPYLFYEDSAGPAGKTLDVPLPRLISSPSLTPSIPIWSMGLVQYIGLYTFIWLIFMVNGGKYTIPMDPTWKIIPVSKWFISMVRFCPLRIRLFPLQMAFLWLINRGDPY